MDVAIPQVDAEFACMVITPSGISQLVKRPTDEFISTATIYPVAAILSSVDGILSVAIGSSARTLKSLIVISSPRLPVAATITCAIAILLLRHTDMSHVLHWKIGCPWG
jgi:hypothetical protein